MSFTITYTNTSTGAYTGLVLRVLVLDNATLATTPAVTLAKDRQNASITTTTTNSRVYGSTLNYAHGGAFTAEPLCTMLDNVNDTNEDSQYGTFYTTAATGTPGSTLVGAVGTSSGSCSAIEVLPVSGIAPSTNASSPGAPYSTVTATTLTTAAFTPPAGKLLIALVVSIGGTVSTTTGAISDTSGLGLTWNLWANAIGPPWTGIYTAVMPGGSSITSGSSTVTGKGTLAASSNQQAVTTTLDAGTSNFAAKYTLLSSSKVCGTGVLSAKAVVIQNVTTLLSGAGNAIANGAIVQVATGIASIIGNTSTWNWQLSFEY